MAFVRDIADDFLSLFFPRVCPGCNRHLVRGETILCMDCLCAMMRTDFHLIRGNALEQIFWGRCLVEKAAAFSVYNRGSRIRRMVHLMKYRGRKEIGDALGNLYGTYLNGSGFLDDIDVMVPVPLHPARLRRRGYNQSESIANGLSEATGIRVATGILTRALESQTQTRRGRYERWENVEGLFVVTKPEKISGKHILLVDDVITTGSTMEACVNALHDAAADVRVSVIALAAAQKLSI